MQATRPALRLADLGPGLFEGLVLKIVALEQFPLFFRELLDGATHSAPHLLELHSLVSREHIIRHLHGVGAVEARAKDHGEAGDCTRDAFHLVFEAPATTFTIGQVAEVCVGPFPTCRAALQHAHLPEAVVDGALDAVVGEGQEVRTNASVEALCGFQEADLAPGDQLLHLELGVELLAHLGRQRPNVGAVLLQNLCLRFRERQRAVTPLALPWSRGARASGPGGDRL